MSKVNAGLVKGRRDQLLLLTLSFDPASPSADLFCPKLRAIDYQPCSVHGGGMHVTVADIALKDGGVGLVIWMEWL